MITRYVRFKSGGTVAYGILEDSAVRELRGSLFSGTAEAGITHKAGDVKLLRPCEPGKILAVGRNYKSHLHGRPQPAQPEMFFKPVSALQDPDEPIVIPRDATNVHFEGELVVVIGATVQDASADEAREAIFGITCGNDVSEREWQHGPQKDLQWWRAKGSDTFAPLGPAIAVGADYDNLMLRTRLNGEVLQDESTSDLIFDCATVVSYVSRWVTLHAGDVIYTGTPGNTQKMKPGDVVEVELDGVGILRNPVVSR